MLWKISGALQVTETPDVAMRLSPTHVETPQVMRLLPSKDQTPNRQQPANCPPRVDRRATLLRSSSLMKLRNFCTISCDTFPSALLYLQSSSTSLKASVNHAVVQLNDCLLMFAVYLCIACLCCQVAAFTYVMLGKAPPPGLLFMIGSALAIVTVKAYLVVKPVKRASRGRLTTRTVRNVSTLKKSQ